MGVKSYDFSGWATRNDLRCSDGRIIRRNAFKVNDGQIVPLVWNHQHNDPFNVLGHALLENRDEGVYAYCSLNDTEMGLTAKKQIEHGDYRSLSIYANQLKQDGPNVIHGQIREVSLVLAGANPGAFIDALDVEHSEDSSFNECLLFTGEDLELSHSDEEEEEEVEEIEDPVEPEESEESEEEVVEEAEQKEDLAHAEKEGEEPMAENKGEKTVQEVFDTLTEEQKTVVYALIGQAVEDAKAEKGEDMKHNVFENDEMNENVLSHSDIQDIFSDAKRNGSLKDSVLAHTDDYGIEPIDYLFPDAKSLNTPPEFIKRDTSWVSKVMGGVHHTPFSRIKSMFADITEDEARARGYIKGNRKKEEVFTLLKRTTTPTTVYKKQKLDRDDIVDITDFDVVSWIKQEMRGQLDEELARAILIGDGRSTASDDKINESNIRPIWTDDSLYAINTTLTFGASASDTEKAKAFIKACIKSRKEYKGTGTPTLFTTADMLSDMLLIEDGIGHFLYKSEADLCTTLRVKEIVTVEVMENITRIVGTDTKYLLGIIINLNDYNVGADKGGAVNMFDDFDIDFNQQKYLIETRCSGALIKPYSAIVIESKYGATLTVEPEDQTDTVLGKLVSAVQDDDIIVNDSSIKGTLKYISNWTEYSATDNSGNFLVLKYAHTTGSTTTVSYNGRTVTLDSDMNSVTRVVNKHIPIIVTSTNSTTGAVITKKLDLSGLTLEKA